MQKKIKKHVLKDIINVVHNGVDSSAFNQDKRMSKEYLYNKYNIPKNNKIILTVGSVDPRKNQHEIISCLSILEKKEYKKLSSSYGRYSA